MLMKKRLEPIRKWDIFLLRFLKIQIRLYAMMKEHRCTDLKVYLFSLFCCPFMTHDLRRQYCTCSYDDSSYPNGSQFGTRNLSSSPRRTTGSGAGFFAA